jgi:hypothetical protein
MKMIIWGTVLVISMLCCSVSSKKSNTVQEGYSKIQFELMLPIIWQENKGKVNYIKDTVILYFNKHRLIYRLPYMADSIAGNSGDTILKALFTQYNYYLFKDTLSNGYRTVNEYKTNVLGIARWDSINVNSKWYGVTAQSKTSKAVYMPYKRDTAGTTIYQTLVLKTREMEFDVDTVLLTYTKKHPGDHVYSFMLDADTIPGYKLTENKGIFKPLEYEGLNIDQRYYRIAAIFSDTPSKKEMYILDSLIKKLPPDF